MIFIPLPHAGHGVVLYGFVIFVAFNHMEDTEHFCTAMIGTEHSPKYSRPDVNLNLNEIWIPFEKCKPLETCRSCIWNSHHLQVAVTRCAAQRGDARSELSVKTLDVQKMSRRCQCVKDVSWVSRVSCVSDDPWHAYNENITEQKICVDLSVALCMKIMKINEAVRCWDPRWTGIRGGAVTLWEKGIGPDRDAGLDMRYTSHGQNCWKPL